MLEKMLRRVVVLGIGVFVTSSTWADAELLHVEQIAQIAAPAGKVWKIVKNFDNLTWVPLVKGSTATDANSVGSIRTLDLGGASLTEELVSYDAVEHTYTYAIQNTESNQKIAPVSDAVSSITVKASKGGSVVIWKAAFRRVDRNDPGAAGRDDESARIAFGGVVSTGLKALKAQAEK